jgi:hypothetical protein
MDFDQIPVGDFDAPSDSPTSGIRGLVGFVGARVDPGEMDHCIENYLGAEIFVF